MLTVLYGATGSGKSRCLRKLDNRCLYIDMLNKNHFTMACSRVNTAESFRDVAKLISETDKDTIVIDDFSILIYDELNRRCMEKGYDKYSEIAGSVYKFLKFLRQFSNKHIVLVLPLQFDSFGFNHIALGGSIISEKVPFAMMCDGIYKTEINEGEYVIRVKSTGNDLVKDFLCQDVDLDVIAGDFMIIVNGVRRILSPSYPVESSKSSPDDAHVEKVRKVRN